MIKVVMEVGFVVIALFCSFVAGDVRDEDLIEKLLYQPLKSTQNACVRRSNYTHTVGCQSHLHGQYGVLFLVDATSDIDLLYSKDYKLSYVAVLTSLSLLNLANVIKLRDSNKIEGILLLNDQTDAQKSGFSTAKKIPNEWINGKDENTVEWNTVGDSLFYESFNFPIVQLSDGDDILNVQNCLNLLNEPREKLTSGVYPLCSASINTFQFSSGSTSVCLRRSQRARIIGSLTADLSNSNQCSPLGGLNSYGQLKHRSNTHRYSNSSVIVVASRIDANSFFYDFSPLGTQAYASGVLTMLEVINWLKPFADDLDRMNTSVVFIAFDGEFYDNSGSLRAVYDMSQGVFPTDPTVFGRCMATLDMSNIKAYIELSQLANATNSQFFSFSTSKAFEDVEFVDAFESVSKDILNQTPMEFINASMLSDFPPSSLQSLLRESSAQDFHGTVITDHDRGFHNKYYGDSYDLPEKFGLNQTIESGPTTSPFTDNLRIISEVVAKAILKYSGVQNNVESDEIEKSKLEEYAYCMLINVNCSLIRRFEGLNILQAGPAGRYVSIADLADTSSVLTVFRSLFAVALSNESTTGDCQPAFAKDTTFLYFKLREDGSTNDTDFVCYRAPVYFTSAESPAFINESLMKSGKYPAWSESYWSSTFEVKLYATGDRSIDIMALTVGIMVTFFSFIIVLFVQYKSHILFRPSNTDSRLTVMQFTAGNESSANIAYNNSTPSRGSRDDMARENDVANDAEVSQNPRV